MSGIVVKTKQNLGFNNVKFTTGANTISLKNEPPQAVNSLSGLNDVVATDTQDGNILVYNAQTNKYILEPINQDITYIDGGSF